MENSDVSFLPISAVMPIKDGERWIENIQKILNILCKDSELICVFNNNSDHGLQMAKTYRDPRLRVFDLKSESLVKSLNFGIDQAKNDWIVRLDIDDLYEPNRIKLQLEKLNENTSVIFTDYRMITEGGLGLGQIRTAIFPIQTKISLSTSSRTAHSSALINKKLFYMAGKYVEEDFPCEDLGLWLRLSQIGQLVSVPETLMHYRLSTSGVSTRKRDLQLTRKNLLVKSYSDELADFEGFTLVSLLKMYEAAPKSAERQILFLRDLLQLKKLSNKVEVTFFYIYLHIFRLVARHPLSAFTIGYGKLTRMLYRKFLQRKWA